MKRITDYSFCLFLIILLISCNIFDEDAQEIEYFIIKVDSITGPDTITVGDTIIFNLDGYIGPDGCYMFSHFEEYKKVHETNLKVWGKHIYGGCTHSEVFLEGKKYVTNSTQTGIFRLKIRQPDNKYLVDTVIVKAMQP